MNHKVEEARIFPDKVVDYRPWCPKWWVVAGGWCLCQREDSNGEIYQSFNDSLVYWFHLFPDTAADYLNCCLVDEDSVLLITSTFPFPYFEYSISQWHIRERGVMKKFSWKGTFGRFFWWDILFPSKAVDCRSCPTWWVVSLPIWGEDSLLIISNDQNTNPGLDQNNIEGWIWSEIAGRMLLPPVFQWREGGALWEGSQWPVDERERGDKSINE